MTARFITAEEITGSFSYLSAVNAIEEALLGGLDPAGDLPRSILPIEKGELLLMPSTSVEGSSIKVLTIAPNNPALNEPRIQGIYLLFDKDNLSKSTLSNIMLSNLLSNHEAIFCEVSLIFKDLILQSATSI